MEDKSPKLSIIVPVYNTEKYLEKCLDSLVNQSLQDIEIIVVNDGSKDNSQKIIDRYVSDFPQVKSFEKSNGGLSDARNFGIDRAKGEFIGFVDSDDYVDLEMFQKMVEHAKNYQSQLVLCDLEKVDENGIGFRILRQSPELGKRINLYDDLTVLGELDWFACNKLFHRDLFEKERFKKGIHFEDVELVPRLLLKSSVISKIQEPYYKYFERQDSITKNSTQKGLDMFISVKNVTEAFQKSDKSNFTQHIKRFQIIQLFYAYLAYVAFVKDKKVKAEMVDALKIQLKFYGIRKSEIIRYQRFNRNYLFSLPMKKQLYYMFAIGNLNFIKFF